VILRTFLCIEIPAEQKNTIGLWLDARRRDVPDVRWVRPETLHITLKFCGEIQEDMVQGIIRYLTKFKQKGAFMLQIQGIGAFPSFPPARIVWTGVTGALNRLQEVQNAAENAALSVGLAREPRRYTPHITLGRRNSKDPFPQVQIDTVQSDPLYTEAWQVNAMILMKSELFPDGPKYTPLGVFKI